MKEKFKFEIFQNVGGRFTGNFISVTSAGFGFGAGFCQKYQILKQDYVVLHLARNKEQIIIGFSFTKDGSLPGVFKLTKNNNSGFVGAHSFFNACDINFNQYGGRYTPNLYTDPRFGKLFVIELRKKMDGDE